MCEEESDDSEAVAKLLEINDSIHRTIERYKLTKKGDLDAASKIPKGTLGTSTGVSKTADNELSLIDFGGDSEPSAAPSGSQSSSSQQKVDSLEDDLLGLSFQDNNYGQAGGIALGFGANTSEYLSALRVLALPMKPDVPGPSLLSTSTQQNSATTSTSSTTPQIPQNSMLGKPNYDPFASLTSSQPSSRSTTPAPSLLQSQQTSHSQRSQSSQPSLDPFAILSSPTPRHASPFSKSQPPSVPTPQPSASIFDFASSNQPSIPPHDSAISSRQSNGKLVDDDWDFTSALPDDSTNLPRTNDLLVSKTEVSISFEISRPGDSSSTILILAHFSNNTDSIITEYEFQVAVTRVCSPPI